MTKTPCALVVEDDQWQAEQYERILATAGVRVEIVPHALAAIDAIDEVVPDVVVLDILLPGPNAFTLLHELHSHTDLMNIPVVLCTTIADQISDDNLTVYGVCCVLDKAVMRPEDLVAAVKKVLP